MGVPKPAVAKKPPQLAPTPALATTPKGAADTKAFAAKKRAVVIIKSRSAGADAVAEFALQEAAAAAEDDKSISSHSVTSVATDELPPMGRVAGHRSGLLEVKYSQLVPPQGLSHRSLAASKSPTAKNNQHAMSLPVLPLHAAASFSLPVPAADARFPLKSPKSHSHSHPQPHPLHPAAPNSNPSPQTEPELDASSLAARLSGLPGELAMTKEITSKYFGPNARGNFRDRIGWLQRHRDIAFCPVLGEETDSIYDLHFSEHLDGAPLSESIPFAPDRSFRSNPNPNLDPDPDPNPNPSPSPNPNLHPNLNYPDHAPVPSFYERFKVCWSPC